MFYAIVGIPLCLLVLADLGKLLTRATEYIWAACRQYCITGKCHQKKRKAEGAAVSGLLC
jgi:hypothetical protein